MGLGRPFNEGEDAVTTLVDRDVMVCTCNLPHTHFKSQEFPFHRAYTPSINFNNLIYHTTPSYHVLTPSTAMQHHPLKRRRSTSSIHDDDNSGLKRQKLVASVFKQLQQTAEEVRCALNSANWLSVEERVRAALIIDHVAGMSRMMGRDYEFGDEDREMDEDDGEEYEYGDGEEDEDNVEDVIGEVAYGDVDDAFVEDVSGSLEENDENEGRDREVGGDEDGDGDSGGEEADEEFYSSWIRRGVSFSADAMCTACTESGGS